MMWIVLLILLKCHENLCGMHQGYLPFSYIHAYDIVVLNTHPRIIITESWCITITNVYGKKLDTNQMCRMATVIHECISYLNHEL